MFLYQSLVPCCLLWLFYEESKKYIGFTYVKIYEKSGPKVNLFDLFLNTKMWAENKWIPTRPKTTSPCVWIEKKKKLSVF